MLLLQCLLLDFLLHKALGIKHKALGIKHKALGHTLARRELSLLQIWQSERVHAYTHAHTHTHNEVAGWLWQG
jgi:hypothetical protein